MDENDLKKYTVILGGGSGVLFQPVDSDKTYILSAKHVFYDDVENERGIDEKVFKTTIDLSFSETQNNKETLEIKRGENYFEHSNEQIDAAILTINNHSGYNQIYTDENPSTFDGFSLTGYPESKRAILDKYNKYKITELISSNNDILNLRLAVTHLAHRDISGFSGGGIMKINKDSLIITGIQSKTPIGDCNGEISVVPIKKFQEIIEQNNSLSQLLPSYLSKITELIDDIIKLDDTNVELKPKIKAILKRQLNQVKLNLATIFHSNYIEKSCTSKLNKKTKHFWTSFLEYALIISLIEDNILDEDALVRIIKEKKFIFSDSDKGIYEMFSDILLFASEEIENECQILVGSVIIPKTKKTRRILTKDIPKNIASVDDVDYIDRVAKANKIKELIHLKAIEFDCINENEEQLNTFNIEQFEALLNELKKIVNEFLKK